MSTFLDLSDKGKNNGWRYLLSLVVILFLWMIVGSIPFTMNAMNNVTSMEWNFIGLMVSFIPFILGVWFSMRVIHKRGFITLITTRNRMSWKRYLYGFGVSMLLISLLSVVDYLLHPEVYRCVLMAEWSWRQFAVMFFLCLLLIPIQTAAEEVFFRGYVLQGLGRKIKNVYVLSVLSGILFALPHLGNPEVAKGLLPAAFIYFGIGFILALITLRSNSLELAMGIHCANNMFGAVVVGMSDSALLTRPIFMINEWDIWGALVSEIILFTVLYVVIMRRIKKEAV